MEEDVRKPLTIMTLHESWDDFDRNTRYPLETTLRQAFEAGYKAAQAELLSLTEQLAERDAEIEQLRDELELLLLSSDDIYPGDVAKARAALANNNGEQK